MRFRRRSALGRIADSTRDGVLRPPTPKEEAKLQASAAAQAEAKAQRQDSAATAKQDRHDKRVAFLLGEAEKYAAKADELESKGNADAAARARKVSDNNRAKAEKLEMKS